MSVSVLSFCDMCDGIRERHRQKERKDRTIKQLFLVVFTAPPLMTTRQFQHDSIVPRYLEASLLGAPKVDDLVRVVADFLYVHLAGGGVGVGVGATTATTATTASDPLEHLEVRAVARSH